ncbi:MAG: helix-turn-helix domain-containing protein [Methylacidiphilales bacterium]|nr:helix-turn-helix domain-containing protein [Candidatus Methylacidiphilales bacterium]
MLKTAEIVQHLSKSQIYHDYEAAFNQATQLPLAFRPHELWQHAMHGKKNENPFCALMAKSNRSCAACLQVQQELVEGEPGESTSSICFAGLCDTAVPVSVGNDIIGFLQTGQVALRKPTEAGFTKVAKQLIAWGVKVDLNQLQDAYFHSKVLSKEQYGAMVRLLEIFSKHLSVMANQILVEGRNEESPMITRAKRYIGEHQAESLSLDQMAKALNVSTFYFCKMFKKATGLTFTDYLARTRIERAKNLLLNPHVRISEVAYDCGFISLTHFNRIFKRVMGKSPTEYRRTLPA